MSKRIVDFVFYFGVHELTLCLDFTCVWYTSVIREYLKFARHRSGMQVYEKAFVMKASDHLQTLELKS
ncbi:hypothetical protein RRG08_010033 [Elysia crispata]|uniref:Uncharacterized protein n=1 Tax=Elysia crispata TaxID=231223 RepID=A0AAE1CQZ8_9GAST|nr:hypothetical protein RRG08_010033 [Elysia crispata]